MLVILLEVMSK